MGRKGDNLSKIRQADKYKAPTAHMYWMTGVPERIKIQQREARLNRELEKEELEREPEPGYGLDGYPLQKGKRRADRTA